MSYRKDETYTGWTQDVWWLIANARGEGAKSVDVKLATRDGHSFDVSAQFPTTTTTAKDNNSND